MPIWLILALCIVGTILVGPMLAGLATGSWREALSAFKAYTLMIGGTLALGGLVAAFMFTFGR